MAKLDPYNYGHKLLHLGDFGPWYCDSCKNGADETGPQPQDVPCVEDKNNPLHKGWASKKES